MKYCFFFWHLEEYNNTLLYVQNYGMGIVKYCVGLPWNMSFSVRSVKKSCHLMFPYISNILSLPLLMHLLIVLISYNFQISLISPILSWQTFIGNIFLDILKMPLTRFPFSEPWCFFHHKTCQTPYIPPTPQYSEDVKE